MDKSKINGRIQNEGVEVYTTFRLQTDLHGHKTKGTDVLGMGGELAPSIQSTIM